MNHKVLLVEDEPSIQNIVKKYLVQAGFEVTTASNGFEALQLFDESFDIICLDLMMPNVSGWEVCETVRAYSNVPIIIMTAASSEEEQLKGYSLKIDDYITKPFNIKILVEKVKSILNRVDTGNKKMNSSIETKEQILKIGAIEIDKDKFTLKIDGKLTYTSKTEFDLLCYLIENQGELCSREQILDNVWSGDTSVETRIVDAYIKKIRKTLGSRSNYIKTVFGVGYRFIVE